MQMFFLTSPSTASWQPKLRPVTWVPSSKYNLASAVGLLTPSGLCVAIILTAVRPNEATFPLPRKADERAIGRSMLIFPLAECSDKSKNGRNRVSKVYTFRPFFATFVTEKFWMLFIFIVLWIHSDVGSWIFALSPSRYLANMLHFDWLSCLRKIITKRLTTHFCISRPRLQYFFNNFRGS